MKYRVYIPERMVDGVEYTDETVPPELVTMMMGGHYARIKCECGCDRRIVIRHADSPLTAEDAAFLNEGKVKQ